MNPQESLKYISRILQTPQYVNLPYPEGAKVNEQMAVIQTALRELESLKKASNDTV